MVFDIETDTSTNRPAGGANRSVLGVLVVLLAVAVMLALWFLLVDSDDNGATELSNPAPTPVDIPLSTAVAADVVESTPIADQVSDPAPVGGQEDQAEQNQPEATTAVPTPLPDGLTYCEVADLPVTTTSYKVDTNSAALKHRAEPSAQSPQLGESSRATTGLRATGDCAVNTSDGFTWWQLTIDGNTVWVASEFLSPS